MWEYLVELFEKPAIMLTTLEQIIMYVIIVVGLIIVFALFIGVVYIYETIKERKEQKTWLEIKEKENKNG